MPPASKLVPPPVSGRAFAQSRAAIAFGPRFYVLLIIGLVWIGPGWFQHRFLYAIPAWDLLVLALWAWDLRRMTKPGQLFVRREWRSAAALDCDVTVTLALFNRGRSAVRARLLDDVPDALRRDPPEAEIIAARQQEASASYVVHPRQRGDLKLNDVFIRYQSGLRLAERWAVAKLEQSVRVYPNLEEAKKHTVYLVRSRQIEQEKRLQRRRGLGREFESLRDYREGDEWRDVCWTATARRGKLIAKVHQVERSQAVWLVVDSGRLLRARVGNLSKLDYAVNAALTLAHVALFSGDRVGLLAYGRRPQQYVGIARGAAHLRALTERLAVVNTEAAEADHMRAAQSLLRDQKRRALIVWLTDLAETAMIPEVVESAMQMMPRHIVLFAAIAQPELAELAEAQPADPEEMFRRTAAQEMVQRRDLLLARLRQRGALAIEVEPGKLSTALVNHYLEVKERSLI